MTFHTIRAGLAAAAALGGLAAVASAQPTVIQKKPEPQVIKWPGGYMVLNGKDVILRQAAPGKSTNVIAGAGNGVGNRIVVDGGPGGVTVVSGSRLGFGNTLVVNPDDLFFDLDACLKPKPTSAPPEPVVEPKSAESVLPEPLPAAESAPSYKGKANAFWAKKAFNEALDCNLYWDATTRLWFRYHAEDDAYRPVPAQPPAPAHHC